MTFNTGLVDPKEFASYWDLVKPKWKGKIAAMDPKLPGFPSGMLQFAFYHPNLGARFLRQLFGGMDIVVARDGRQLVDWLRWESLPSRWLHPRAKFRPGSGRACP